MTRRYTGAPVLVVYSSTGCGWLTSAPPGTVAPLNEMTFEIPMFAAPTCTECAPVEPPGKKREEMSVLDIDGISSAAAVRMIETIAVENAKRLRVPGSDARP